MFKLESYITPLILSYVDKYIKNLKPEDSQVSLWGGDAVFSNLDLRLDVLEQELRMPFTFANGHIHELRIHVPWTKLGSEPVVITINTIECVLKLCEGCDGSTTESSGSVRSGGGALKVRGEPKVGGKQLEGSGGPLGLVPPNYVQSLINRVLNNIAVVCNNVVLKYVEDDIVLSLNVKSVEMSSVNKDWEKAFVDLTLPELVLRKLVKLLDLTVCLDRRNASGKITTYQDPLLYRCSLDCRLHVAFDSLHAKHVLSTKVDILCDQLDFSVTDHQLPMFLRLLELCLALHANEIPFPAPKSQAEQSGTSEGGTTQSAEGEDASGQEGWGAWMWSYVPNGLSVFVDDPEDDSSVGSSRPSSVFHMGLYIKSASFVVKVAESAAGNGSFSAQKVNFRPLGSLQTEGVFVDIVTRGIDVLNVQMGMTRLTGVITGRCTCGIADCQEESPGSKTPKNAFFVAGGEAASGGSDYLGDSLFDEESLENVGQRREYHFEWDEHFNLVSNVAMQKRTPAFAMDYFYLMEIPEDFSDKSSGFSVNDLEYSNLKERTVNRIIIGPASLDVTSSVYHRLNLILRASEPYDYEPYSKLNDETMDETVNPPTLEEVSELEKFVPSRILRLLVIKPTVRICMATHQRFQRSTPKSISGRLKAAAEERISSPVPKLPSIVVHGEIVDVQRQWAMYPRRVVKAAGFLRSPSSDGLLHNCHLHFNAKLLGCGVYLDNGDGSDEDLRRVVVPSCNVSFYHKRLFFPSFWRSVMQPKSESLYQAPEVKLVVTMAQIMLLKAFWNSWFDADWKLQHLAETSLVQDAFNGKLSLELAVDGIRLKTCDTDAVVAYDGACAAVQVHLLCAEEQSRPLVIPVLHGSEDRQEVHTTGFFQHSQATSDGQPASSVEDAPLVSFTIQLPKDASNVNVPGIFVLDCKRAVACLDPRLFKWLAYLPRTFHVPRIQEKPSPKPTNEGDCSLVQESQSKVGSGLSSGPSTLPTESRSKSRGASNVFQEPADGGGFPESIARVYPLLHGLNVHVEIGGFNVFVPTSPVPWPADGQAGIAATLKRLFSMGKLCDAIAVNLPRISVANDSQKHANLRSGGVDVPVSNVEGWSAGSDQFPWAVRIDNHSVFSLTDSRDAQYCLNPGFVSATVAVNSKNSLVPIGLQSISQLNVCIHCDFQPIRFQLSKVQAQLVTEAVNTCYGIIPNICGLVVGTERGHLASGLAAYVSSPEPATPTSAVPPSRWPARSRKISATSSAADATTVKGLDNEENLKNYLGQAGGRSFDGIKVSLWLQTTLPKLAVDIIGVHKERDWRLNFELEDISSSIDIQEVYSKIKLKVASLSATNYLKNFRTGQWDLGPYEGISICCSDRLTKTVHMPNPKTGIKMLCPHASFSESDDPQSAQGSFLLATFTRAQCRNVQKRWTKILRDYSGSDLGAKLRDMFEKSSSNVARRHISEIDLKIASFDCVFVAPLVDCVCGVFAPILEAFAASSLAAPPNILLDDCLGVEPSPSESGRHGMPTVSTTNLPLLYFNCSTMRVFVPKPVEILRGAGEEEDAVFGEDGGEAFSTASTIFGCHRKGGRPNRSDDLIVLQVGAIYVSPNVENPLSRVLLKPDVYNVAQRAGILLIPGSEVEERQYQIDVTGLCLSTGSWNELIQFTKNSLPPMEVTKLKTMSENPALEWNMKIQPEISEGILEVIFCPLVSRFDLRIIAAPAIVYEKGGHLDRRCEDVLVAGHSLEINATTDIEFYIGLHQVSLLVEQLRADLELLRNGRGCSQPKAGSLAAPLPSRPVAVPTKKHKDGRREGPKEARDSGIDSEASTLGALLVAGGNYPNPLNSAQSPTPMFPLSQSGFGKSRGPSRSDFRPDYTPFDVLLTAGRITVSVYNVEEIPRNVKPQKPAKAARSPNATGRERVLSGSGSATKTVLRKRSGPDAKTEDVSTSTEGSPARIVRNRSRQLSSKELELITELAGYEGSEESLDDGSSDENADSNHPSDHHIIPLFYLLISQPYTFLKCSPSCQKLELSCFDVNLKGSSTKKSISHGFPLLKPENYDVFWFETLPGDPDPKTGIPPALYTLTLMDFLTKPTLNLKLERPLKTNLSISKHREISNCLRGFETILRRRKPSGDEASNDETAIGRAKAEGSAEELTEKWRKTFAGIRKMSFQAQQMVFAFDTESLLQNAQVQVCSSQATGSFLFRCDRDELLKEADVDLFFGGCLVKTRFRDRTRTLLGPFSLTAKGNSIWENWNIFYPFPQTLFKLCLDTVPVGIDQEHLACLEVVTDHVKDHFGGGSVQPEAGSQPPLAPLSLALLQFVSRRSSSGQQQVWQDDLRIGVFQYTQDADDLGLMPGTNEIVFCKEHGSHPASMTWRYPQPRALIRTEIHPVPFRAASETTNANWDSEKVEVQCALQAWDVLHSCFITYRVFHLSETEHGVLDLPPGDAESCKDLVISHMWRVVMDYTDPDDTYDNALLRRGLVSPLALAACMRVDSCFNPLFVPCFEFLVDFELVKITLSNYFPRKSSVTGGYVPSLVPYELDASRPEYQEFLAFSVENTSIRGRHWNKSCKLEVESVFFSELLDFKFLVLQSLLEPVSIVGQISVTQAEDKPLVAESSVDVGALHLRLGQSSIHTLALGLKAWSETEENRNCYLMNSYVICNGTQETLRFGQVDTDESIAIRKYQAHAYSWRTHKSKQVLHVCVEGMKWKWCDPFSIDEVGIQVRVVENKTQKATLIVRIDRLNNAQNQITISAQLTIASRLAQPLEIRVKSLKQHPENSEPWEHLSFLEPMSCIPSFVVQHEDAWYLQVKLVGENNHWSRGINIDESPTANGTLVKLPSTDSGPLNSFWCHVFTQPCGAGLRKLVLLTPLYVVRTHLPSPLCLEITTPALGQTHSIDVEGNGQEHQIDCPGDTDLTHQLSFRLAPGLDVSSPPLPLSPTMILQASKQIPVGSVNIDELCNNWNSLLPYLWPYDSEELERDVEMLPKNTLSDFRPERTHPQPVNICQPNIELEVSLVQRWPGCQSLLVDVKPWGLVINKTGLEITFHQKEDLAIPKDAVFALSRVEGTFKLGVTRSGQIHYSNTIELSSEDWSLNRYWPKVSGVLSRNGHVLCTIGIEDGDKMLVCYLTIRAREKEGIRIFTVRPHYTMVNVTDRSFEMAAFAVSAAGPKTSRNPEDFSALILDKDSCPVPVLFWDVVGPNAVADHDDALHYVKFRLRSRDSEWSLAARLRIKAQGSGSDCVYSVVCIEACEAEQKLGNFLDDSKPFLVTSHHHGGSTFLFLKEDEKPSLKLHNNCSFALFYGQGASGDLNGSAVTVQEESEFLDELPVLPPQTSRFYTFPFVAEKFPEIYDPQLLPRLHLAERRAMAEVAWSDGIGVFSQSDQFLNIPDCGDIRVHVERSAVAVHVFLDPVNRIEVSAKEIRSRIKAKVGPERATSNWRKAKLVPQKVKITVRKSCEEEDEAAVGPPRTDVGGESPVPPPESQRSSPKMAAARSTKSTAETAGRILFYCGLRLKHLCLTLVALDTEVLRLSLDRLHVSTRPLVDSGSPSVPVRKQEVLLCVGDLQADNQLQALGGHDFPVILIGDAVTGGGSGGNVSPSEADPTEPSRVRREALVSVAAVLQRSERWHVQEVDVALKPLAAYVEDTLLYALGSLAQGCQLTVADRWPRDVLGRDRSVPVEVRLEHVTLTHPLRVQRLTVRPVSLLLSVRASLKLFIALDHTPLAFQAFRRQNLTTTWYRLGHNLAMHYLSGAVFRAGWVVGSLDLLANPCGFARAVSTGMADFFRLPYQGLMHGPWAFVVGVSQGSSSLFRHVSSGTLVSLTNLASSISRNMDRLGLDQGHLERNEEMRRCPPSGIGSGLAQGLTGLGISLLGAVAGIVDHPFQSIQGESEVALSPTATAASVISGVGKGLVGIVTKPIGGAAEFVAQTGQGILHGAGWAKVLKCRYPPTFEQPSGATNSVLKYRWKMLPDCPPEASVFAIEATHINGSGSYAAAVLLLTPEVLFVVSVDSDTQQQAFPLMELNCVGHAADPTLVYFLPREAPDSNCLKPEEKNLDRITEFVSRSSKYMLGRGGGSSKNEESESTSDSSSQPGRVTVATQFFVNPRLRGTFLTLYQMAQRKVLLKGYPV